MAGTIRINSLSAQSEARVPDTSASDLRTLFVQRSLHATQCELSATQCGLQMTKMACQVIRGACQMIRARC